MGLNLARSCSQRNAHHFSKSTNNTEISLFFRLITQLDWGFRPDIGVAKPTNLLNKFLISTKETE